MKRTEPLQESFERSIGRRKSIRVKVFGIGLLAAFALLAVVSAFRYSPAAQAQDAKSNTIQYEQDLQQVFATHVDFRIDPQAVAQEVRNSGRLSLVTLAHRFDLQLQPHDMRAPDYRSQVMTEDGVQELPRGPVNTYKGTVDGIFGTDARFTIDDARIEGMILTLDETYFVEPANKYSAVANAGDYVLYKASDVRSDLTQSCPDTLNEQISLKAKELAPSAENQTGLNVFSPLRVAEIATEADDQYVTQLGTPAAANNEILSIMNQVDAIYQRDIGLTFSIVLQNAWSGNNDPYVQNGDANAVLNEFMDYWNRNVTTPRDLAHMWTGRSLGGASGYAFTGIVCRGNGVASYGVTIREQVAPFRAGIPAHEIGHNFGANHADAGACANTIMSSLQTQSTQLVFCQVSIDEITNYINANGACLAAAAAATIQLNARSYVINEDGGRATIVINRTDSSGPATVNYATSDAAGGNDCNVNTGAASQRCDYAISIGTLRFAAGEASKNLTIPIVDDVYAEGNENLNFALSSPTGATLGGMSSATITIQDNDAANGLVNPINDTDFFVRQHYIDFLGREPEPGGLVAWRNRLNGCPAGDISCDRIEVSSAFFRSPEFQDRGLFIYRFYPTIGKVPIYEEYMPDLAKVSGFLTAAELEANKAAFAVEFTSRAAFQARYAGLGNDAFVDTLCSTVGLPNHPGKQTWKNALNAGSMTRAQVTRALVESGEMAQRYFTEAFVIMQYFGYLRRTADASYLAWVTTMNADPNNYRVMISGFLNSLEYRRRFGPA
ncbi:MAG TPA: zinc-dependent metalloprotease family protein [Pyrinomonadaceae bacterium]|nr:zinc-dependent metalloprotease family protein [Pyrinomonadaceae bacterium]